MRASPSTARPASAGAEDSSNRRQNGHRKSMKASTRTGPGPMTTPSPSGVAPAGTRSGMVGYVMALRSDPCQHHTPVSSLSWPAPAELGARGMWLVRRRGSLVSGRGYGCPSQPLAHLVAVETGQHHVEHD